MNEYHLTTVDLAARLSCHRKTVRAKAEALGLGINLGGRAGFRYSDADLKKLIDSMRPVVAPAPRRRRRAEIAS